MTTAATRQRVRESFSRLPGHLVRRVHQVATAYFAEECGADLTAVQYAALVAIGAHPGIDATRLSDRPAARRCRLQFLFATIV